MKIVSMMICVVIIFAGCKKESMDNETQQKAIPVRVFKAEEKQIEKNVDIFGRFYPENQVMVFSKITGKVKKIYVSAGQSINKGQLLAEVIRDVSGQEFAPHKVVSPLKGTVLRNNISVGMSVSPQTVLFDVGALTCLVFRGQVFGSDRSLVKNGQILTLFDDDSKKMLSLSINQIAPVVDAITGGLTIEAEICFTGERPVFAGQTISGKIMVDSEKAIIVPREALVKINNQDDGVFTVSDDNKAVFNNVKVLQSTEDFIAIEGINPGEDVIIEGSNFVSEGSIVKVYK